MADTEDTEGQSRALPEKKKRKRKKVASEYVFLRWNLKSFVQWCNCWGLSLTEYAQLEVSCIHLIVDRLSDQICSVGLRQNPGQSLLT